MIPQLLSRLRMRQHLAAQQAAAALRYQSMGMPGQGMPMAQQPYAYPHMGMGGMYGAPQPQPQLQYGGPYGSQGGVGHPHQAHQAAPYTGSQLQFQPPPAQAAVNHQSGTLGRRCHCRRPQVRYLPTFTCHSASSKSFAF